MDENKEDFSLIRIAIARGERLSPWMVLGCSRLEYEVECAALNTETGENNNKCSEQK